MRSLIRITAVVLSLGVAAPGAAGPFEDARAAYERGDYATAMRLWRPLADQGDARAQYNLGIIYYYDDYGVRQDFVSALVWFNLAAAGGYVAATNKRGLVTAKMTAAQITEAQKRTAEWRPKVANAPTMPSPPVPAASAPTTRRTLIPVQMKPSGTFTVPVSVNNALTLDFMVDTGASDVSIPADVVLTLMRTGTLSDDDFLGKQTYKLADGSTAPSQTFRIKSLKVGERTIENVTGSISPVESSLLLGQSFLRRFKSWSIDNQRQVLVLE